MKTFVIFALSIAVVILAWNRRVAPAAPIAPSIVITFDTNSPAKPLSVDNRSMNWVNVTAEDRLWVVKVYPEGYVGPTP